MPTINDANSIYMPNRALEERERRETQRIMELRDAIAGTPERASWAATNTVYSNDNERLMLEGVDCNIDNLFAYLRAEQDNFKRVKLKSEEQEILVMRLQRHVEALAKSDKAMAERLKAMAESIFGPKTFSVPDFKLKDPKSWLPAITESMRWGLGFCRSNLPTVKNVADSLFPDGRILDRSSGHIKEVTNLDGTISQEKADAFREIANAQIFTKMDEDIGQILFDMVNKSSDAKDIVNQFRIGLYFTDGIILNDIPLMSRLAAKCSEACHRVRTLPQNAQKQEAANAARAAAAV